MFGVEFGHQGDACTFEVLATRFGLDEHPAIEWIARIVHDLDLRERRFGEPEAPGIELIVEGLRRSYAEDAELLERGHCALLVAGQGRLGPGSWGRDRPRRASARDSRAPPRRNGEAHSQGAASGGAPTAAEGGMACYTTVAPSSRPCLRPALAANAGSTVTAA